MKNVFGICIIVACLANAIWCKNSKLVERFSWKQVDFDFPDERSRMEMIKNGIFIPENNLPLGLERWKNKLFVTLPRWKSGTAATLTYIDLENTHDKSPKLKPYPNWEAHRLQDRNNGVGKIANVFRLNVDVCDRLWLVDTGVIEIIGKREVVHDAKIVVYDLNTNRLVKEFVLPQSLIKEDTFLANIIVDVTKENCGNAFAYIADLGSNALLVYSMQNGDSWRITHHFFHLDPLSGDYNIGGVNFQWIDGIFGLALSPIRADGYRTLYFHPMSSTREFAVSTRVIRNKTNADSYYDYKALGTRGPNTQSSGSSMDERTGVLFYTLLNKNAVGCWNSNNGEYSPHTNGIVGEDDVTMVFPNDLKVDKMGTLWVLTDRLPNFLYTSLNFSDVNFRIFSGDVKEIVKGTVCSKSSSMVAMNAIAYGMIAIFLYFYATERAKYV